MYQRDEKFPLKRSHAAAFPSWRQALSHFSYLQHDRKCPVSQRPFDNLNSSWHYFSYYTFTEKVPYYAFLLSASVHYKTQVWK